MRRRPNLFLQQSLRPNFSPIGGGVLLQAQWGRSSLFMVAAVPAFVAALAAVVLGLTQGDITAKADTAVLTH